VGVRIVGIDTTSEFGSLALVEDGITVEELLLHSPDGFGHVLFPQLLQLIEKHGWRADEVNGYAAASGPGSFTGVRVGLAAAKGMAEAAGSKAAGISNLEAMASLGSGRLRAPFLDARRGEIYGAVYGADLGIVRPEVVSPMPRWLESLPEGEVQFLTPDPAPFVTSLAGREVTATPRALAAAIARLAGTRLGDPASVDANYVRRSDAELLWKED
jgi:tRNA threonylcarbamoyladenosine biosynthesis protein TsaB